MPISTQDYNRARDMLISAGSQTALKSHPKHGGDSWPDEHGRSLLQEARDEFNLLASPEREEKRAVVVRAAEQMGITEW